MARMPNSPPCCTREFGAHWPRLEAHAFGGAFHMRSRAINVGSKRRVLSSATDETGLPAARCQLERKRGF